eukprot:gnl/MRDRNA2_/MRDRNA2_193805_c0_seq1.p1 gnl/MRDRNA2_/MRDRNA2_193805_c0~~gnl/MRDRNA2_/MRDRNA2_193805_c0_seq1.p1  ORF type:complete len:151 (-),score=32.53 gnl/MRDRNA2_/MRDRNA2_193805_c0_seq1:187-639(-)
MEVEHAKSSEQVPKIQTYDDKYALIASLETAALEEEDELTRRCQLADQISMGSKSQHFRKKPADQPVNVANIFVKLNSKMLDVYKRRQIEDGILTPSTLATALKEMSVPFEQSELAHVEAQFEQQASYDNVTSELVFRRICVPGHGKIGF